MRYQRLIVASKLLCAAACAMLAVGVLSIWGDLRYEQQHAAAMHAAVDERAQYVRQYINSNDPMERALLFPEIVRDMQQMNDRTNAAAHR